MNLQTIQELKQTLTEIQQKVLAGKFPSPGLCNAVYDEVPGDSAAELFGDLREQVNAAWSLFSGDDDFPIPGGEDAYWKYGISHKDRPLYMWSEESDYGQYRRQYLQHWIDIITNLEKAYAK